MSLTGAAAPPARGTRPRNRREVILQAAAELFAQHGYGNVSMADVARAVNVRTSALYRHFSGKQDLLREAILSGSRRRLEALDEAGAGDLGGMLDRLAASALTTRRSTVLWTQEVRNLDEATRREIRTEFRALPARFATMLAQARPELSSAQAEVLAWAALDVLASIAFHQERLPAGQFTAVLRAAMERLVGLTPPVEEAADTPAALEGRTVRREVILRAAADLFARRGYTAATLEDIGAAIGLSGTSLYAYFPSKQRLLTALVTRSLEWQEHGVRLALRGAVTPAQRLEALIDAHVDFTFAEPELALMLLSEKRHLDAEHLTWVEQTMRDSVAEWAELVCLLDPTRDPTVARIQVQAARMVVLDVVSTTALRDTPNLRSLVHAACRAVLELDPSPRQGS